MAKKWRRIFAFLLACILLLGGVNTFAEQTAVNVDATVDDQNTTAGSKKEFSYEDYLKDNDDARVGTEDIVLTGSDALISSASLLAEYKGESQPIKVDSSSAAISWKVNATEKTVYTLKIKYIPIEHKGKDISLGVKINGKSPFAEASALILPLRWVDEIGKDGNFEVDDRGNDLIPNQLQSPEWTEISVYESRGFYSEPLNFVLEKGVNTITLETFGEPFVIKSLTLCSSQKEELMTYKEYYSYYSKKSNDTPDDFSTIIQAEKPIAKSDPILYPVYDRSDPKIQPSDSNVLKRNIIGAGWKEYGQYLEWEFDVAEDGLYRIAFKYRQDEVQEASSLRTLTIDGEIPFKEAEAIGFEYSRGFSIYSLGNEKQEYSFYFKKGTHRLRLQVNFGALSEILRQLTDIQDKYSEIYRKIIMVTSTSPDFYRDYDLEKEIPSLTNDLKYMADALEGIKYQLDGEGKYTADTRTLDEIIIQLKSFVDKPYTIPERLNRFSSNNTTLASYITNLQIQPLELDYIMISSEKVSLPKDKASFFEKLIFEAKIFINTFASEYSTGEDSLDGENTIEVWLNSGREQQNILTGLINSSFTQEYGIDVNLKLVHCTLVQSILANMEPDIMVSVGRGDPVDLALRGAVAPLNQYDGFEEMKANYSSEAFVPYTLENKIYAIPETQSFNMMFYRKDILEELNIKVPTTWDEFYNVSKKIIHKNMEVGLPYSADYTNIFPTILMQNGGKYFNEEQTAVALDSDVALESFKIWTDFYSQLSFSMFKDDYNRFRTGEMPLAIMNYTFYNTLSIAAPEILGKWEMTLVPGTIQEDGTIDHSTTASGSAVIMLEASEKKELAWQFIKWWTSADVQAEYGNRIEYILGPSARYTPANLKAFENIPWSDSEAKAILKQWDWVKEIPNVPGSYYVTRNIDNAFRAVTMRSQNYRESLNYWSKETNKEITRKRKQYGLD